MRSFIASISDERSLGRDVPSVLFNDPSAHVQVVSGSGPTVKPYRRSAVRASQSRAMIAFDMASSRTALTIPPCIVPRKLSHCRVGAHFADEPSGPTEN